MNTILRSIRALTPTIIAMVSGVLLWFGGTDFSAFEGLAVVVMLATLGHSVITNNFKKLLPSNRVGFLVLVLAGLFVLPLLYSQASDWLFTGITIYLMTVYWITTYWRNERATLLVDVAYGYLLAAVVFAVFGFVQYSLALLGFDGQGFIYEVRWRGLLDDPVVLGALLVPAVAFFGYRAVYATSKLVYWRFVLMTLLCFAGLILTGSRGAWLNLFVVGVSLVLLQPSLLQGYRLWNSLRLVLLALGVAVMIIFVIPIDGKTYYTATLEHRFTASDGPRIENIQRASTALMERSVMEILLGSGGGSYEVFSTGGFSAHNTYLRVLFEQGVVGIGLFILLLYWCIKRAFWHRQSSRPETILYQYRFILLALLLGVLVQSLFVDTLHWRHFWLLLAFI